MKLPNNKTRLRLFLLVAIVAVTTWVFVFHDPEKQRAIAAYDGISIGMDRSKVELIANSVDGVLQSQGNLNGTWFLYNRFALIVDFEKREDGVLKAKTKMLIEPWSEATTTTKYLAWFGITHFLPISLSSE